MTIKGRFLLVFGVVFSLLAYFVITIDYVFAAEKNGLLHGVTSLDYLVLLKYIFIALVALLGFIFVLSVFRKNRGFEDADDFPAQINLNQRLGSMQSSGFDYSKLQAYDQKRAEERNYGYEYDTYGYSNSFSQSTYQQPAYPQANPSPNTYVQRDYSFYDDSGQSNLIRQRTMYYK